MSRVVSNVTHRSRLAQLVAIAGLVAWTQAAPAFASWSLLASLIGRGNSYAASVPIDDDLADDHVSTMSFPQPLLAFPDPTIACSHSGNFTQGQMFRTYTIIVSNLGAATSGTVTVTDTLPAGLTAVSIGGTGWSCLTTKLTCTRSDVLDFNLSYPAITLTVNVAPNAPASVANVATVSSSPDKNAANNTSTDNTTINAAAPRCGTFAPPVENLTGAEDITFNLAVADFNGDGYADLAVAYGLPDNLTILLGNGNGTFTTKTANAGLGTGTPVWVAAGDLDGDGKTDLAVAYRSPDSLLILKGNGDGTFITQNTYPLAVTPEQIALGDVNGDGNLDLAIATTSPGVLVMRGNGDGSFGNNVSLSAAGVGDQVSSIAVADFNGDGKADVAAIVVPRNQLKIFTGNGDGTFNSASTFYPSLGQLGDSYRMAVGDLNGDGHPDIAVVNQISKNIAVLINDGSGSFAAPVSYSFDAKLYLTDVALGDFNGDGKLDLAAVSGGAAEEIRLGNGDGTFGPIIAVVASARDSVTAVSVGDFDGDGEADLAFGTGLYAGPSIVLNACSDMALTKTHSGNFSEGQTGVNYTLTASNNGGGIAPGPITVTDTLPDGLRATAMSGTGWTCDLSTLTCTHTASFSPGQTSAITLTVDVTSYAVSATNTAALLGGNGINTANDSASDPTTINSGALIPPTNVVARADSDTQVTITWDRVLVAARYYVYRITSPTSVSKAATVTGTTFIDTGLTKNTAYAYVVSTVNVSNAESAVSAPDLATTTIFVDDPLVAGVTPISATHLTQLRTAVNAVRTLSGLPTIAWTDPSPAGVVVKAVHFTELQNALVAARAVWSFPPLTFSSSAGVVGGTVLASDFQALRTGVK